jgi:hypothetical protein
MSIMLDPTFSVVNELIGSGTSLQGFQCGSTAYAFCPNDKCKAGHSEAEN